MELIARSLSKAYGTKQALADVSLTARPGLTVLLGPNGSGKSTLLRLLATVAKPDAGEIAFGGRVYGSDLRAVRRHLGYLPQELTFPDHLTPRRLLHYLAQLKGVAPEPATANLLAALKLEQLADRPLGTLSGGEGRRVGLAQALLGDPRLLILDEPTAGLDPDERDRSLRLMGGAGKGRVVLFSSNLPSEVEGVAGQVVVLARGRVRFAGSVEQLRQRAAGKVHEVTVANHAVEGMLQRWRVSRVTNRGPEAVLRIVGELPSRVAPSPVAPSLEDGYLLLVGEP
jgi:ABC-2 type transport system ATP-binding protein